MREDPGHQHTVGGQGREVEDREFRKPYDAHRMGVLAEIDQHVPHRPNQTERQARHEGSPAGHESRSREACPADFLEAACNKPDGQQCPLESGRE